MVGWHERSIEPPILRSGSNESKYEIWTMDDDGSNKTRKLYDSNANYRHPRWSPDGTKLAFFTYQGNASSGGDNWVIKVVNSDGSWLTQVNDFQTGGRAWPSFDWSPDGSSIAFIKLASSNNYDIFSINIDGSNLTQLTNTPDDNEAVVDWGSAAP